MEKQSLVEQLIINCLDTAYGIVLATLTLLPIGADRMSSVYEALAQDQTVYFIKLKQGHHHDSSVMILNFLQEAGIQQIIPPIKTIHGRSTHPLAGFTLIVYPFVKAENGFNRALTNEQWRQFGKTLRQVHALAVPESIQNKIRREEYSPKWRESVRALYGYIEGVQPAEDEIALKLKQFMREHIEEIRRLVDHAEELAQQAQRQPSKFVLCHSDLHGGNVLLQGSEAFYLIDWDDPIMAPKERDLMFIGGGVANVWNKPDEKAFFYEGYGEEEVNAILIAYYRHERIVEDIAVYGQALLLTTAGGDDRAVMYQQFIDMFAPNGVVDIAFKSDSREKGAK